MVNKQKISLNFKMRMEHGDMCFIPEETESRMLDYTIAKEDGIYYIYDKPLRELPAIFASKETSRYLPLSDSWRKAENRKNDCTERITALLQRLS